MLQQPLIWKKDKEMEISKRIDEGIDSSFDLLDCHDLIIHNKIEQDPPQRPASIDQSSDRSVK